ncbi:hypothetical protein SOVF_034800, partial [Spinacia oleracea]
MNRVKSFAGFDHQGSSR